MVPSLIFTALAMVAFAGNSLLARAAFADGAIDAAGYTAIRLVSGAVVLGLIVLWQRGRFPLRELGGSWGSALALFAYAIAFSYAYLRLGAATGALVLFASVQATMIGWGIARGSRPGGLELLGVAIAFAAFVWLLLPGIDAPDLAGSLLMILSGAAWGAYSLRGRGAKNPIGDTAGNFLRSAVFCLPLVPLALFDPAPATASGIGLAIASGAVASGLGYAVWYRALPQLTPTQAAVVQLTVPVIAAAGAALLLAEALSPRLLVSAVFILGGVALAILSRRPAGRR